MRGSATSAAPTVSPRPGSSCSAGARHAGAMEELHGGGRDQRRLLGGLGEHRIAGGERGARPGRRRSPAENSTARCTRSARRGVGAAELAPRLRRVVAAEIGGLAHFADARWRASCPPRARPARSASRARASIRSAARSRHAARSAAAARDHAAPAVDRHARRRCATSAAVGLDRPCRRRRGGRAGLAIATRCARRRAGGIGEHRRRVERAPARCRKSRVERAQRALVGEDRCPREFLRSG